MNAAAADRRHALSRYSARPDRPSCSSWDAIEDGALLVPHRHTDARLDRLPPARARSIPLQLWSMSHDPSDAARLERFPERRTAWREVLPGRGKGDDIHIAPWYCYLQGENWPTIRSRSWTAQWAEMARRMERMRNDDGDPETWDVHHWQDINPVHTEALVQLTCGGPQIDLPRRPAACAAALLRRRGTPSRPAAGCRRAGTPARRR